MSNPLQKHFRHPGGHTRIPSCGHFTPAEEIEFSINGELEVYPMTAADEILVKNPDGLLNGSSIEKIIKSCVPGVKNPRNLPTQDIDVLLLNIKKYSYGDKMTVNLTCPHCKTESEYNTSIEYLLSRITFMDQHYMVRLNDELIVNLRPYDYESTTKLNLATFEETKLFKALMNSQLDSEQKMDVFTDSFEKISRLNLELLARCIVSIATPETEVTDPEHIKEFVLNTTKENIQAIKDKLQEVAKTGLDRTLEVECVNEECKQNWSAELLFDPANFFA